MDSSQPLKDDGGPGVAQRVQDLQQAIAEREHELAWTNERLIAELHERAAVQASAAAAERYDPVCGLPNRRLFEQQVDRAALEHEASGEPAALLLLGIDQLVGLRASLGFRAADTTARITGERLRLAVRGCDLVGRIGDGEFAVALTHLRAPGDAAAVARKLIDLVEAPLRVEGREVALKAAVGVALLPGDGTDAATLMQRAFSALRSAGATSAHVYQVFEPAMAQREVMRLQLQADMRKALHEGQFLLHYQPRVSLHSRRVIGAEALLRWMHPQFGLLPAAQFIDLADASGLIVPIGESALARACLAAADWPLDIVLSVNLSARQLCSADLGGVVGAILRRSGLAPDRLQIEVSEAALGSRAQDMAACLEGLDALRQLGVGIALDQFGTGACSLTLLRDCAPDALNLEGSFVRSLTTDETALAIVQAVAALGRHLGVQVVAEGVETEEQFQRAAQAGCSQAQGYLFGRPMPLEDFNAFLAAAESDA